MSPVEIFGWGVLAGIMLMCALFGRWLDRMHRKVDQDLRETQLERRELEAARVDVALSFAAIRRAVRDEVRS